MSFYKEYLKKKEGGDEIKISSSEPIISQDSKQEKVITEVITKEEVKKEELHLPEKKTEGLKERLAKIQESEEEERKHFLQRTQEDNKIEPPGIKSSTNFSEGPLPVSIPSKPSKNNNLLVRLKIVLGLIFVISLVFSLVFVFIIRDRKITMPREEETKDVSDENIPEPINEEPPRSLINYDESRELIITEPNGFQTHLNQIIQEDIAVGKLIKITFSDQINPQSPRFHRARDFFGEFRIDIPGLFEKIDENNSNLFVYSQEEGNRIGTILKITEPSGFLGIIREWEPNSKESFTRLFELLQKNTTPEIPVFLSSSHRGETIWCQEYEENDFGICYSVTRNNLFILSTSLQSIKAVIDKF